MKNKVNENCGASVATQTLERKADDESENSDQFAWLEAIEGVKPLLSPHVESIKPKKNIRQKEKLHTIALKQYNHDLEMGVSADIDGHTMRRFKREEFPVEGILDLHGYTESKAFEAVHRFVTESYMAQKRCIIIVTGKGIKRADEDIFAPKGVLKDRVPQWLKGDNLKQLILTYVHPSERLGGTGALYILLRRRR